MRSFVSMVNVIPNQQGRINPFGSISDFGILLWLAPDLDFTSQGVTSLGRKGLSKLAAPGTSSGSSQEGNQEQHFQKAAFDTKIYISHSTLSRQHQSSVIFNLANAGSSYT